jgi:DNA-binding response OmpR family regulator
VRIALLEDDLDQARLIKAWLEEEAHSCQIFDSGREFIRHLKNDSYDAVILDWLIPDMSGLEVLVWIRDQNLMKVPVLFVTRLDGEDDIVRALKSGADDYMRKPLNRFELLARLEAIVRRANPGYLSDNEFEIPPYLIKFRTHNVLLNGEQIPLTQKEFDLAVFLFKNANQTLSRGHILENVWGTDPKLNTRTVDTHISRIRKKLGIDGQNGWTLVSVYQHGYRLESHRMAGD